MGRLSRFAVAVLAAPLLVTCGSSPVAPATNIAEFEQRLEVLRVQLGIPGMSAAIVKDQRIVWARGFGMADAEAARPATDTTSYHLASLTKTYASTIIMRLVEAGRLNLDAPVSDFGITLAGSGTITVRHLLTHTSHGTPGAQFAYNGDRFALLGQVIRGAANDSSFGQLLQRHILAPLGTRHTAPNPGAASSFALSGLDRDTFLANLAQGYTPDGLTREAYPGSFSVSAGLVASARDVAAFSMALDRNAFVSAATQALAWTPFVLNSGSAAPYGLGWFVTTHSGRTLVWHYGYWTANSSLIIKSPSQGLTFVLLANSDMLSRPTTLGSGNLLSSRPAREFVNAFVLGTAATGL